MKNKLFIGGLAWGTTEDGLRTAFAPFGEVEDVRIITDRETGRSRGFGFVTFTEDEAAARCKDEMDGAFLDGRAIRVDFPRERDAHGGGGGFRGGEGGGGYRGGEGGGGGYRGGEGGGGGYRGDHRGGGSDRRGGGGGDRW